MQLPVATIYLSLIAITPALSTPISADTPDDLRDQYLKSNKEEYLNSMGEIPSDSCPYNPLCGRILHKYLDALNRAPPLPTSQNTTNNLQRRSLQDRETTKKTQTDPMPNCLGSWFCPTSRPIDEMRNYTLSIDPERLYQDKEYITCVQHPDHEFQKGGNCVWLQRTKAPVKGARILAMINGLMSFGVRLSFSFRRVWSQYRRISGQTQSSRYLWPDCPNPSWLHQYILVLTKTKKKLITPSKCENCGSWPVAESNDTSEGFLTINYVKDWHIDGCKRGLCPPNCGKSPCVLSADKLEKK